LKIAYLVNQYPKISHSFIRREIQALEAQGVEISRYSVRPSPDTLVDAQDQAENAQTEVILTQGFLSLILPLLLVLAQTPQTWLKAFVLTLQLGYKSPRGIPIHLAYLGEACWLWQSLKKKNISHLHAHFGTNSTTVALLCQQLGAITYSFTVHGPEEFDQPLTLSLPRKIAGASFVVAISSYGRSQLYRWCPSEAWSKIHLVRCGVDEAYLNREIEPVDLTQQIVCVGRLSEQKGQILLLQAFGQLIAQGIESQLVLVGDGELRTVLTDLIHKYQLEERVKITGWANTAQVQEYLLSSRALVLASFAEGLPVVIMEALALARPVLSTYIAGIPELVEPDKSGWLVPAGSQEALTAQLKVIMELSPARLTEMGTWGRERVQNYHNVQIEAQRLQELFSLYSNS
jgi:glycosyltransferase involved in cell wall biosynthesis